MQEYTYIPRIPNAGRKKGCRLIKRRSCPLRLFDYLTTLYSVFSIRKAFLCNPFCILDYLSLTLESKNTKTEYYQQNKIEI